MSGQHLEYRPFSFDPEEQNAPVLLEIRGLSKQGQFHDVDLTIHGGEIVGLTGLVGSGRTELALSFFGLNLPDNGKIFVDGKQVDISSPQKAKRLGISYLPEDRHVQGLFEDQSIADNIITTVVDDIRGPLGILDENERRKIWTDWVERLAIKTPSGENSVSTLSGGNQQRVVLAKWLAVKPNIFILDGPTIGVDVVSKARIHDVVQDLAATGMGILLISDEVNEVLQVCSRVLVMRNGRIVKEFRDLQNVDEAEVGRVVAQAEEQGAVS
jgi:simple sugar transport system ATP-binding protein